MNLLMFNMSNFADWEQGIVNRNFFILKEILRSQSFENVFLVDFLAVQSLKKQFGVRRTLRYAKRLLRGGKRQGLLHRTTTHSGEIFGLPHVTVHAYEGLGFLTSPKNDLRRIQDWLHSHNVNAGNLAVWSYNAVLPEALDIAASVRIFDAVDNWSLHASYEKESKIIKRDYQLISGRADIIFTVSDGLRSLFPEKKAHWVPNGVDLDAFAHARGQAPQDIAGLKRPIIGYVGTVQERLDFELMEYVCAQHKEASFVFIGPVWSGVKEKQVRLQRLCPNVHFLGRRPYNDIPQYISAMDAAIIPHRLDAFINSTNPMKMYDYLAAAKPVITTPGAGTDMFEKNMYVAETAQAFSRAIGQALQEDNEALRKARLEAVADHTWAARVKDMLNLIKT